MFSPAIYCRESMHLTHSWGFNPLYSWENIAVFLWLPLLI